METPLQFEPKVVNFSPGWCPPPVSNNHFPLMPYPWLPPPFHHGYHRQPHFPVPPQHYPMHLPPFPYYHHPYHLPPVPPPPPRPFPMYFLNHDDDPPPTSPILVAQIKPDILSKIIYPVTEKNPEIFVEENSTSLKRQFQIQKLFNGLLENPTKFEASALCKIYETLSLTDQLQSFLESQDLSQDQLRIRWQIAFDTLHILRKSFPQCQVFVFGSLLTGLGTTGSDIDMYVDLFGDDGRRIMQQKYPELVASILRDEINKFYLQKSMCPHSTNKLFAHNINLMGKRIPFIRFSHGVTGIMCDLSFGNRISVQNSRLLSFYLNYDPRVGPLLVFLRYWAKFHGISGELKIKQYALALMTLVYLMKRGILPGVSLLQDLQRKQRDLQGIPENPDRIGEWDASFCENRGMIDEAFQQSRIPTRFPFSDVRQLFELALDFFQMYAELDMGSVVICALRGEIVGKEEFLKGAMEETGSSWWRNLKLRSFWSSSELCIQDPFVVTFNVGGIAKGETVKEFQKKCGETFRKLSGQQINSILDFFLPLSGEEDS